MPRLSRSSYLTMSHTTIHTSGVENLIRNLNPHKATGPDVIPAHLLCKLSAEVAPALSFIFQMSLDTGQIPDDWRMAYFAPVYKKCDKCSVENYCPVSITSICSKAKEHILFSNIMQHLDKDSILMDAQHGFLKNHLCKTQLITINDDMTCNLSSGKQINAVFLDFAKAFNNVPHQRLLLKLEYYDIGSYTLQWIGSFLNNRKQGVVVESVVPVTSGVPQGTVLGLLLFLIFIHDLTESITSSVKLFADDCLVYRTIYSSNDAIQLQEDLYQLGLWMNS